MRSKLVHTINRDSNYFSGKKWGRFSKMGTFLLFLNSFARKSRNVPISLRGFTFIEILIALVVVAVLFIPMIQLFSNAIYAVTVSGEGITAVNLARWEMERVKNLNVTKSGLKKIGDVWTPGLDEPALEINQAKWRIFRHVGAEGESSSTEDSNAGPLMVKVEVYRDDNLKKPMATVATLIEDSIWI